MTGWTWAATRRASLSVLLAGLHAATPARAQTAAGVSVGCGAGATAADTSACARHDFEAADATIAVLYADVMRALSAHERPQLRQEHSAWQRDRVARCKQATRATEQQPDGPRSYHECLTRETQQRRQGIMRWLSADTPAKP